MRVLAICFLLAACSDSSSNSDAQQSADAYDVARCLIKGDFGMVGTLTGTAGNASGAPTLSVTLDPGPPGRDAFFIKLVMGKGVFASGLATGTFNIAGVDAGYNTCGLCVHIIADIVSGSGPSKFYFADAGSVTLTSTSPIAGTASNVWLTEVDINSGMKVAGGCQGQVGSIAFSAM